MPCVILYCFIPWCKLVMPTLAVKLLHNVDAAPHSWTPSAVRTKHNSTVTSTARRSEFWTSRARCETLASKWNALPKWTLNIYRIARPLISSTHYRYEVYTADKFFACFCYPRVAKNNTTAVLGVLFPFLIKSNGLVPYNMAVKVFWQIWYLCSL